MVMEQIFLILAPKGFEGAESTTPGPSRGLEPPQNLGDIHNRSLNLGIPPYFFFFATRVRSPRCPTLTPAPGGLEAGNSRDSTLAAGSPSAPWDQPLPHTAPGFPNLSQNPGSQPFPHRGPPQHPPAAPLLHLSSSPDPEFLIFLLYPVHSLVGRAQTNPPGQSSWSIGANSCLGMLGKSAGSDSMLREVNADD